MRSIWMIFILAMGLPAAAGNSLEPKDALLSLLDDLSAVAADPNAGPQNTVAAAMTGLAPEPNLIKVEIETPMALAEPNVPAAELAKPVNSEFDPSLQESRRLRQGFFRDGIAAVETLSPKQQEKNLDQLISQLNALMPPVKTAPANHVSEPNEVLQQTAMAAPVLAAGPVAVEPNLPPQTSDPNDPLLRQLQKADAIVDPLQLADALFRKGYVGQAYEYYQQAADQLPADDVDGSQWALFQMANCCSRNDPAKAVELYTNLLTKYPNSQWSDSALSHKTTLEWIIKQELDTAVRP